MSKATKCIDCNIKPVVKDVFGFGEYLYCPKCGLKGRGGMSSITSGGAIDAWNRTNQRGEK